MKATRIPIIEEGKNVPYVKVYNEQGFVTNPHNGYFHKYPTTRDIKGTKVSSYKVGGGNHIQMRNTRRDGMSKAIRHLTNHLV